MIKRIVFALIVLLPLYSHALKFHKWVDENGKVHYGDKPQHNVYKKPKKEEKPEPPPDSPFYALTTPFRGFTLDKKLDYEQAKKDFEGRQNYFLYSINTTEDELKKANFERALEELRREWESFNDPIGAAQRRARWQQAELFDELEAELERLRNLDREHNGAAIYRRYGDFVYGSDGSVCREISSAKAIYCR